MIRLIRFLITGDWRLPPQVEPLPPHQHVWEDHGQVQVWDAGRDDKHPAEHRVVLRCTVCGDVKSVPL